MNKSYAKKQEKSIIHHYTMSEINTKLNEAEANFEAGRGIPDEEAWDDLEEELTKE